MKYIYTLVLVTFLASCTNPWVNNDNTTQTWSPVSEVTNQELEDEMDNSFSWTTIEWEEDKIEKIEASYKNPKTEVDMVINYSTDDNNNIEFIEASATTYDISWFNEQIQYLVGQPVSEAENVYISGSSLTSEAFSSAIKNNM